MRACQLHEFFAKDVVIEKQILRDWIITVQSSHNVRDNLSVIVTALLAAFNICRNDASAPGSD